MWTKINQVYATAHTQNAWAHLQGTNAWRKIATTSADGVSNVYGALVAAKATDRQVYVALDSSNQITAAYL